MTEFFGERVEFGRTRQWIGVWMLEASLQADTIQFNDRSTPVLLSQQRILSANFCAFCVKNNLSPKA